MTDTILTDLRLIGVGCASCATHIENALNGLDGVYATANFAVEAVRVEHDAGVSVGDLITAIESCGYGAEPIGDEGAAGP